MQALLWSRYAPNMCDHKIVDTPTRSCVNYFMITHAVLCLSRKKRPITGQSIVMNTLFPAEIIVTPQKWQVS